MTVTLELPPELEQRLAREARRLGISLDQYALTLLNKSLPSQDSRIESIALLQSWIDATDVTEQLETGEYLLQALDRDRLSERPHFPPELRGVTW